jgi:hypothetical protein
MKIIKDQEELKRKTRKAEAYTDLVLCSLGVTLIPICSIRYA